MTLREVIRRQYEDSGKDERETMTVKIDKGGNIMVIG